MTYSLDAYATEYLLNGDCLDLIAYVDTNSTKDPSAAPCTAWMANCDTCKSEIYGTVGKAFSTNVILK